MRQCNKAQATTTLGIGNVGASAWPRYWLSSSILEEVHVDMYLEVSSGEHLWNMPNQWCRLERRKAGIVKTPITNQPDKLSISHELTLK